MSVMRTPGFMSGLTRPPLCLAHHEISENLNAGDTLKLFGIDKIRVQLDGVGLPKQLHQAIIFLDKVIRQRRNAETLLAGANQTENTVDPEVWFARARAIAT